MATAKMLVPREPVAYNKYQFSAHPRVAKKSKKTKEDSTTPPCFTCTVKPSTEDTWVMTMLQPSFAFGANGVSGAIFHFEYNGTDFYHRQPQQITSVASVLPSGLNMSNGSVILEWRNEDSSLTFARVSISINTTVLSDDFIFLIPFPATRTTLQLVATGFVISDTIPTYFNIASVLWIN